MSSTHVVMQEGGSTAELYRWYFDSPADAERFGVECAYEGSYRTSPVFPVGEVEHWSDLELHIKSVTSNLQPGSLAALGAYIDDALGLGYPEYETDFAVLHAGDGGEIFVNLWSCESDAEDNRVDLAADGQPSSEPIEVLRGMNPFAVDAYLTAVHLPLPAAVLNLCDTDRDAHVEALDDLGFPEE
ncbi:hypothetical protein [Nocardia sp. NPDC051570]|uniref:hypothetical protein n=1 Tax=Nocardia sp. NPDC051570 TaxID=3364324 RepID=UPI0037978642